MQSLLRESYMKSLSKSFKHAFIGLGNLISKEPNAKIHAAATITVIVLGIYYQLNTIEWVLSIIAILMVWAAEAVNTAIECLADEITTEMNSNIKLAKDLSAGAVLLVVIVAVIIGIMVFGPYFLS
ncbi:MAG TPA: diacylglycerol kinase family protein [Balneolales bacterium]|nr:diacylglycerol kinase family protein [Balneolales bacterium]